MARSFSPRSASAAAGWKLDKAWRFSLSLGHTERAPAFYELFAQGPHVATAAYERGDSALGVEQSRHAEAGLQWDLPGSNTDHGAQVKLQAFDTRFARFIALDATGLLLNDLPEYRFRAVRAHLQGWELESRWRVPAGPWALNFTFNMDAVRGDDLDARAPLARLAPRRTTLGAEGRQGAWKLGVQWRHQARQDRVPATDRPTPGASRLDAWMSRAFTLGGAQALWMVRAQNLTDALWFNASTVQTMRGLSPAAGRSVSSSVRVEF
jgi:iron complex outermembrane receptor protein